MTASLSALFLIVVEMFRVIQINDPVSPVFLAMTAGGALRSGGSFATTYTGKAQVVIVGLKAGPYNFYLNGNIVPACSKTVNTGDHVLECSGIASGLVVIEQRKTP